MRIEVALAVLPALWMLAQSALCLSRRDESPHLLWLGVLALLAALLTAILQGLLSIHVYVFSPEFGSMMAIGRLPAFGLAVVVGGLVAGAGLAWHTARVVAGWPSIGAAISFWSIAVMGLAVAGIEPINREEGFEPVYTFDLWQPPFPLWIALALSEAMLAVLAVRLTYIRVWAGAAALAVLGLVNLGTTDTDLALSTASNMWLYVVVVCLPVTAIGAVSIVWRKANGHDGRLFGSLLWVEVAVGFLYLAAVLYDLTAGSQLIISGFLCAAAILIVPLSLVWRQLLAASLSLLWRKARRIRRSGGADGDLPPHFGRLLLLGVAAAATTVLGFTVDRRLDTTLTIAGFGALWILATELAMPPHIRLLARWEKLQALLHQNSPLRSAGESLRQKLLALLRWSWELARRAVAADSIGGAIVKIALAIVALIVVNELPNAGKTIIHPFRVVEGAPKNLGEIVADSTLNSLRRTEQALRPELARRDPQLDERGRAQLSGAQRVVVLGGQAEAIGATTSSTQGLEIGGVKMPLDALMAPIQAPIRRLLGVTSISGTYIGDAEHGYALWAGSSNGHAWKLSPPEEHSNMMAGIVEDVSEQLAFQILRTDRLWAARMTESWEAYRSFLAGLAEWREYSAGRGYARLTVALTHFRAATRKDPTFALANYRLGLALREDGQPAEAIEAFRAGVAADPKFVGAQLALADTLYGADFYQYAPAGMVEQTRAEGLADETNRTQEARRAWRRVIDMPGDGVPAADRAEAHLGLCRLALAAREYRQAYFHCALADEIFVDARQERTKSAELAYSHGAANFYLAHALRESALVTAEFPWEDWHCDGVDLGALEAEQLTQLLATGERPMQPLRWRSRFDRHALEHFERAWRLIPHDAVVQCERAKVAAYLGHRQPMDELARTATARAALGRRYMVQAWQARQQALQDAAGDTDVKRAAGYFRLAMDEYAAAMEIAPSDIEILNQYAYGFWLWRYALPRHPAPIGPDYLVDMQADEAARAALRMVSVRKGDDSADASVIRSTLAEVLLAQARPEDAIDELVLALKSLPPHAWYGEIYWDLAQAYRCAAYQGLARRTIAHGEAARLYGESDAIAEKLKSIESLRESRPYTLAWNRERLAGPKAWPACVESAPAAP